MKRNTTSNLQTQDFEGVTDGKKTELFLLSNAKGVEMSVSNYGAKIVSLHVPDRHGRWTDVVLGKSCIADYLDGREPYLGAICGRTANRIAGGRFVLDGAEYPLAVNNGPNSLHGGIKGFHAVVWDLVQASERKLDLSYLSVDGEEGFPGNLKVALSYELTDDDALAITYRAETDRATIINLTNHSYFNLSGEGDPSIGDHLLQMDADLFLPTDAVAIPLGPQREVAGTPFDFRQPRAIGERIATPNEQLAFGNGYDHNYIIRREVPGLAHAARVVAPKTGITMDVYTTEPGVQLYTGNYLDGGFEGKNGHRYPQRSAFCLETQHYPDAVHHKEYPSVTLRPSVRFESKPIYRFSVSPTT
jgi:aldose 1-epimerase